MGHDISIIILILQTSHTESDQVYAKSKITGVPTFNMYCLQTVGDAQEFPCCD